VSLPVKEFWKSVNTAGSYGQEFGVLFFSETQCSWSIHRVTTWQWRNFVPYLCQLVFAAILRVNTLDQSSLCVTGWTCSVQFSSVQLVRCKQGFIRPFLAAEAEAGDQSFRWPSRLVFDGSQCPYQLLMLGQPVSSGHQSVLIALALTTVPVHCRTVGLRTRATRLDLNTPSIAVLSIYRSISSIFPIIAN